MSNQIQKINEKAVDVVVAKVKDLEKDGSISFPENYSYSNALKSAYLALEGITDMNGNPVLSSCTQTSIVNTLFDMVIQGLSAAKKQCYFIPYNGELTLSRSYFGTMAVTKRVANVDINYQIIYKDDEFEMEIDVETGKRRILKHKQKFESLGTDIKGAYCCIIHPDGKKDIEVMTMQQIEAAWNMRKGNGLSPAHKKFPDQMALKTVIQRACKPILNSSDDSDLIIGAVNRTDDLEMDYSDEKIIQNEVNTGTASVEMTDENIQDADFKEHTGYGEHDKNTLSSEYQHKDEHGNYNDDGLYEDQPEQTFQTTENGGFVIPDAPEDEI